MTPPDMAENRSFSHVLADLHLLTTRMLEQRHDADFLIRGLEQRQALMDEYDTLAKADPYRKGMAEQNPKAKETVAKIVEMDKVILAALEEHKANAQKDVANANAQQAANQRVMDYLGRPASGSVMDYKK